MQCNNYNQHTTLVMRCEKEKGHAGLHEAKYMRLTDDGKKPDVTCWMNEAGKEMEDAGETSQGLENLSRAETGGKVKRKRGPNRKRAGEKDEEQRREETQEAQEAKQAV